MYVTCPMGQVNKINKNTKIYIMLSNSSVASCPFINFVAKNI